MTFNVGDRVTPKDIETAEILANCKYFKRGIGIVKHENAFIPSIGTITGKAGNYVMVLWDGKSNRLDEPVHPLNIVKR